VYNWDTGRGNSREGGGGLTGAGDPGSARPRPPAARSAKPLRCKTARAVTAPRRAPASLWERDETCPVSTEGWTRRVHSVREVGGGATRARSAAQASACGPTTRPVLAVEKRGEGLWASREASPTASPTASGSAGKLPSRIGAPRRTGAAAQRAARRGAGGPRALCLARRLRRARRMPGTRKCGGSGSWRGAWASVPGTAPRSPRAQSASGSRRPRRGRKHAPECGASAHSLRGSRGSSSCRFWSWSDAASRAATASAHRQKSPDLSSSRGSTWSSRPQKSVETDGSDLDKIADPAEGAEVVVPLDKAAVACGLHTRPGSVTADFLLKRGEPKSEREKS